MLLLCKMGLITTVCDLSSLTKFFLNSVSLCIPIFSLMCTCAASPVSQLLTKPMCMLVKMGSGWGCRSTGCSSSCWRKWELWEQVGVFPKQVVRVGPAWVKWERAPAVGVGKAVATYPQCEQRPQVPQVCKVVCNFYLVCVQWHCAGERRLTRWTLENPSCLHFLAIYQQNDKKQKKHESLLLTFTHNYS